MCLRTPPGRAGSDLNMLKEMEEEDFCLACSREAVARVADHWYNTRRRSAAYVYYTDSAPKALTRTAGETSVMWKIRV